jgi:hypothetical protein
MGYEIFKALPDGVKAALLAGYSLPELEGYRIRDLLEKQEYSKESVLQFFDKEISENIDALKDGFDLFTAICFYYSADTIAEYNSDLQRYNNLADKLNEKYGEIVQKKVDHESVLGFIGYRKVPYAVLETTTYDPDTHESLTLIEYISDDLQESESVIRNNSE